MVSTSTVATVTGVTLLTGILGYAVYFDYKRRNDPQFRSRLRKDVKRTQREQKRKTEMRQKEADSFIERTVAEFGKPGALPEGLEREQTFSQQVQLGELMAAQGPDQYLPAAAAFYKALKVYPAPAELLLIYRQAVPAEALDYIHRMVAMDPTLTKSAGDPMAAMATAAGLANQAGSQIEEVDDEAPEGAKGSTPATNSATASQEGSAPSVSSQEWEKVSKAAEEEDEVKKGPSPGLAAPAAASTTSSAQAQQTGQDALNAATGAAPETAPAQAPTSQA